MLMIKASELLKLIHRIQNQDQNFQGELLETLHYDVKVKSVSPGAGACSALHRLVVINNLRVLVCD